jgi:hypothetical protein
MKKFFTQIWNNIKEIQREAAAARLKHLGH